MIGPLGGIEILIILALLLVAALVVIGAVVVFARRKTGSAASQTLARSTAERIGELDQLLSDKVITESEYEERRTAILSQV